MWVEFVTHYKMGNKKHADTIYVVYKYQRIIAEKPSTAKMSRN